MLTEERSLGALPRRATLGMGRDRSLAGPGRVLLLERVGTKQQNSSRLLTAQPCTLVRPL